MVRILIFILLFVTRAMKAVEAARFFLLSLFLIIKTVDCIKSAVVVGAGPSGLASALVLAQRHG
jgi:ribulose 1,5-bisphosphate synthetase/thiazole synthase